MGTHQWQLVEKIMKWVFRFAASATLIILVCLAGTWLASPLLIEKIAASLAGSSGLAIKLKQPGRPLLNSIAFGSLKVKPLSSPSYTVTLQKGRFHWSPRSGSFTSSLRNLLQGRLPLVVELQADDAVITLADPAVTVKDSSIHISADMDIYRNEQGPWDITLKQYEYRVEQAVLIYQSTRLEQISYYLHSDRENSWQQPPERLTIGSISTPDIQLPMKNFSATISLGPELVKKDTIRAEQCSLDIMGWKASAPRIDYIRSSGRSDLTLELENIDLDSLFTPVLHEGQRITGSAGGTVPIIFTPDSLSIRDAFVKCSPGSMLTFTSSDGNRLSLDLTGEGNPVIERLDATIGFQGPLAETEEIRLKRLSAEIFDGAIEITDGRYDIQRHEATMTLRLNDIKPDKVMDLFGNISGSYKGRITGKMPFTWNNGGLTITGATFSSTGKADITHTPPASATQDTMEISMDTVPVSYELRQPDIVFDRKQNGLIRIRAKLAEIERIKGLDHKKLLKPRATLTFAGPDMAEGHITLENFSAGFLEGSIGIDHALYNYRENKAGFQLSVTSVPLQNLVTLQGVNKLSTSGTISGKLPVTIDGPLFEVRGGTLEANRTGSIIYNASAEELLAAHEGLKTTYAALSDFRYRELKANIDIRPDGESILKLQLKGHNPSFQNGREVHLNLNVEQNLLDLLRSLTISTEVEQKISEKARKQR